MICLIYSVEGRVTVNLDIFLFKNAKNIQISGCTLSNAVGALTLGLPKNGNSFGKTNHHRA